MARSGSVYGKLSVNLKAPLRAATTAVIKDEKVGAEPRRDKLDVTFTDGRAAFKSKTTWELVRAYLVYMICSSNYIVDNNLKVSV